MLLGWKSSSRRLKPELSVRGLAICWSCSDCARRFYLTPAEIEHSLLARPSHSRISAEFAEHHCRMISLVPWTQRTSSTTPNPTTSSMGTTNSPNQPAFTSLTMSPHRGIHLIVSNPRRAILREG